VVEDTELLSKSILLMLCIYNVQTFLVFASGRASAVVSLAQLEINHMTKHESKTDAETKLLETKTET